MEALTFITKVATAALDDSNALRFPLDVSWDIKTLYSLTS